MEVHHGVGGPQPGGLFGEGDGSSGVTVSEQRPSQGISGEDVVGSGLVRPAGEGHGPARVSAQVGLEQRHLQVDDLAGLLLQAGDRPDQLMGGDGLRGLPGRFLQLAEEHECTGNGLAVHHRRENLDCRCNLTLGGQHPGRADLPRHQAW